MISLEMAKKLKCAGLKWEPDILADLPDIYYSWNSSGNRWEIEKAEFSMEYPWAQNDNYVFAPRLDQLLSEIEKRGHIWDMGYDEDEPKYLLVLDGNITDMNLSFSANCSGETAAQSLLWILEQEK